MSSITSEINKIINTSLNKRMEIMWKEIDYRNYRTFTREKNRKLRNEFWDAVETYYLRDSKFMNKEYWNKFYLPKRRYKRLSGSIEHKLEIAMNWVLKERELGDMKKQFIYMLWKNHTCLYVGKSSVGRKRFRSHHKPDAWKLANRIYILIPKHGKDLAALECLTYHIYEPEKNKFTPASKRYTTQCPLCEDIRRIMKKYDDYIHL